MPSQSKSDGDYIESAYESSLGDLFKQLLRDLTGQSEGPEDQHYVGIFTKGYNAAKHAKALALGVVGPSGPMIAASATKKRKYLAAKGALVGAFCICSRLKRDLALPDGTAHHFRAFAGMTPVAIATATA
jgi:hypothetical protein